MGTEGISINLCTWSTPVTGVKLKLIACVRPINWAIERLKRRRLRSQAHEGTGAGVVTSGDHAGGENPLVLVQTTANRQGGVAMWSPAPAPGARARPSFAPAPAPCSWLGYGQPPAAA